MESKETTQGFILFDKGEVAPSPEILEKVDQSLKKFKEVVHDELPEGLPPMRDIQHHGTSIRYDFKDPFL